MIVAGIGYRRGAGSGEIVALVRRAARLAGSMPAALAAPGFKSDDIGLVAAAALDLPLIIVTEAEMAAAQPRCLTLSARTQAAVGVASVAEGCALAVAGPHSRLILARITGTNATCAIAQRRGG
ncbi:MAG: cobalamin biosynthesis protein [Acidiphilium sp.]|nr:cobalamin biosynthesis protein [Acidiphilium sp.]MDD4935578.1 cobalamin biosynthesis protein [Acidiphilium sp.]